MNYRFGLTAFVALYSTVLATGPGFAHHGVDGQFDRDKAIEVTGSVTDIKFVNPHAYVYFDVKNEAGSVDSWRCELGSGGVLKRNGWTTEMFADGTEITISGFPARIEEFGCFAETITFADGTRIHRDSVINTEGHVVEQPKKALFSDDVPNINGNWVAPPRRHGGPPPGPPPAAGHRPPGPPPGKGRRPDYQLTAAGEKASEGYVGADNPRFHCAATNIFADWTFDQMVNRIEQTEDDIIITYGFMDIVRTIHLDLDEHPAGITLSRAGHSIGKWEDRVLVIDTIGFASGFIDAPPVGTSAVKNSDQLHTVERFSLSEDGKTLNREYEIEDPVNLARKVTGNDFVNLTDADYEPYRCDDLTNEVVK